MAGKYQHHIWRFLQKGFSRNEFGDEHLWVYVRGQPPRKTVARKHGIEPFFYGKANSIADANITSFENASKHVINFAREAKEGTVLPSQQIAPLIAHLEMRSLFLRADASRLIEHAVRKLSTILSSKETAAKLMQLYTERHPELAEGHMREQGLKGPMVDFLSNHLKTIPPDVVRERSSQLAEIARHFFEPMICQIAEIAKDSHIKALETEFSETERAKSHLTLSYTIQRFPDGGLILPDTTLAFLGQKDIRPISSKDAKHLEILLPISSQSIILGHRGRRETRSLPQMRRILATCAYHNFVAEENSAELSGLSKRIGKNARLLTQSELSNALSLKSLVSGL